MSAKEAARAGLKRLMDAVLREVDANPEFAARIEQALHHPPEAEPRRPHRRAPAAIDPFAVFGERGDSGLRNSLTPLSIDQLKDIVAQHGMDRTKLAMKWKTPDRLIELIIETVESRSRKGDAFR